MRSCGLPPATLAGHSQAVTSTSTILRACVLAALLSACGIAPSAAEPGLAEQALPAAQTAATMLQARAEEESPPAAAVSPDAGPDVGPAAMPQLDPSSTSALRGSVLHVEPAGPYTYVELDVAGDTRWVVVMDVIAPALGEPLTFEVFGARTNFYSKRLARELEELHFGRLSSPT